MLLLISRHGNTFEKGETPTMVGAREDLPLTAEGEAQAARLAEALVAATVLPNAVYSSQLQRTRRYAEIAVPQMRAQQDIRLSEIDYGVWGGLTEEQIVARGEGEELALWNSQSLWPQSPNWQPDENTLRQNVQNFANELAQKHANQTVLVVSSNGVMRYFLTLVENAFAAHLADRTFKVKTGNLCALAYHNGAWQILFWNEKPDALLTIKPAAPIS